MDASTNTWYPESDKNTCIASFRMQASMDLSTSSSLEMAATPWPMGLSMTNPSDHDSDTDSVTSSHAHKAIRVHSMRPRVYSLACSECVTPIASPPRSRRQSQANKILSRSDRMFFDSIDCEAIPKSFHAKSVSGGSHEDMLVLAHKRLNIATTVLDEVKSLLVGISYDRPKIEDTGSVVQHQSSTPIYERLVKDGPGNLFKYCQRRLSKKKPISELSERARDPMVLDNSVNFDEATIVLFPCREKRPHHRLSLGNTIKRASSITKRRRTLILG